MELFLEQAASFLEEPDMTAALANLSALINITYDRLNWAGFYYVKNGELVLGPFQGKPACTHIPFERGVCGLTYRMKEAQRVDDVHAVKDHIACDAASRSELCVPVLVNGECVMEIDLDSPECARFDENTEKAMCLLAEAIASAFVTHRWNIG
ncbi:MAG: GAF domain-containing protein [Solobacterium sp.]|nr:GAF domain-containing protein [Solobacterium sp.]